MKKILVTVLTLALTGCASYGEYYASVDSANSRQVESQRAQAEAQAIKYQALMRIAESGDATAKVAAVMALALGGSVQQVQMAVPAQPQNEALQWASILAPTLVHGYSIHSNNKLQIRQSDNSVRTNQMIYDTLGGMSTQIAKDPVIVNQPPPLIVNPVVVEQPAPIIVEPSYPPVL